MSGFFYICSLKEICHQRAYMEEVLLKHHNLSLFNVTFNVNYKVKEVAAANKLNIH